MNWLKILITKSYVSSQARSQDPLFAVYNEKDLYNFVLFKLRGSRALARDDKRK